MKQSQVKNCGTLYLVATPIGNLSDLSVRAALVLQKSDFIASEDTRITRKILIHLKLKKQLVSYRSHNQQNAGQQILTRILDGDSCALVTDAGTPLISDPGEGLVQMCISHNVPIEVVPGPCAAVAALTLSGFSASRFVFEGFLPATKSKRLSRLEYLKSETRTIIFYEAPHKLIRTLSDMQSIFGASRKVSISRELTKIYEETLRLTLIEAIEHFTNIAPRGEFVVVVEGAPVLPVSDDSIESASATALEYIGNGLSTRDAVKKAARITGCPENKLYKAVLNLLKP